MRLKSAEMLRLLMEQKGFGPRRMARYCGHASHSYISRMMRGLAGTRTVDAVTAKRIAEALQVPIDILFAERDVKSTDTTAA